MKLTNRGISYESNPPDFELTAGEIGSKRRAVNGIHHYPRHIPVPPTVGLQYRDVGYYTGDLVDVEAMPLQTRYPKAAARTATPATAEAVSTVSSRRQVLDELTDTHLANIRQNLERRLQVAQARGDQNLIHLLKVEAKQMALV